MKEITEYIDAIMGALYPSFKFWGLAEITNKSKDRFPVTVNGREKVSLDEKYNCVVWHREISGTQEENEDFNFGLTADVQYSIVLRTIVAYKIELGEEFKFNFMDDFPEVDGLSGFSFMDSIPGSINLDHEAIAIEEEIHTQYNQHRICWNIFTFETNIKFINCPNVSP